MVDWSKVKWFHEEELLCHPPKRVSRRNVGMVALVVRIVEKLKIFYVVVKTIAVFVVNYFTAPQWSANMFGHNDSVLHNISLLGGHWVIGRKNRVIVPLRTTYQPRLAIRNTPTFLRAKPTGDVSPTRRKHFPALLAPTLLLSSAHARASSRTIFFVLRNICVKRLATRSAKSYHAGAFSSLFLHSGASYG